MIGGEEEDELRVIDLLASAAGKNKADCDVVKLSCAPLGKLGIPFAILMSNGGKEARRP